MNGVPLSVFVVRAHATLRRMRGSEFDPTVGIEFAPPGERLVVEPLATNSIVSYSVTAGGRRPAARWLTTRASASRRSAEASEGLCQGAPEHVAFNLQPDTELPFTYTCNRQSSCHSAGAQVVPEAAGEHDQLTFHAWCAF
jgi:hypothetical protein